MSKISKAFSFVNAAMALMLSIVVIVLSVAGTWASLIGGGLMAFQSYMANGAIVKAVLMFFAGSALTGIACVIVILVCGFIISILVGE